ARAAAASALRAPRARRAAGSRRRREAVSAVRARRAWRSVLQRSAGRVKGPPPVPSSIPLSPKGRGGLRRGVRMALRLGIVGFGFIGRHLYQRLMQGGEPGLSVAFVWNRSPGKVAGVPLGLVLRDLSEAADKRADIIVELAHPEVTRQHGAAFIGAADYLI